MLYFHTCCTFTNNTATGDIQSFGQMSRDIHYIDVAWTDTLYQNYQLYLEDILLSQQFPPFSETGVMFKKSFENTT